MTDESITKALTRVAEQVAALLDENSAGICQDMQMASEGADPEKTFRMPLSIAVVLTPLQRDINVKTRLAWSTKHTDEAETLVSMQPELGLDLNKAGE